MRRLLAAWGVFLTGFAVGYAFCLVTEPEGPRCPEPEPEPTDSEVDLWASRAVQP